MLSSFSSFAQRHCDLEAILSRPLQNEVIAPGNPIPFQVYIKNNGPDQVLLSDSLKLQLVINDVISIWYGPPADTFLRFTNKTIGIGDSILVVNYPFDPNIPWLISGTNEVCVRIALTENSANPVVNTIPANDTVCKTFTIGTTAVTDITEDETFLKTYPNPAKDYLSWEALPEAGVTDIVLYDFMGKQIYRNSHPENNGKIPLTTCSPGNYLIKVITKENKVYTRQIVVK